MTGTTPTPAITLEELEKGTMMTKKHMATNFAIAGGVVGALATAALGFAGAATGMPSGLGSAAEIVKGLQAQGYNVMINGQRTAPLTECAVTAIHNPVRPAPTTAAVTQFSVVYVDVSCPSNT